jgi:hypothetical protein
MFYGTLAFIGGALALIVASAASAGVAARITESVIVFGIIKFVRGVWPFIKYRGGRLRDDGISLNTNPSSAPENFTRQIQQQLQDPTRKRP